MNMRWICVCVVLAASAAPAQEFEVVSIKPNHSGSNGSQSHTDPGRLTATNWTLTRMIQRAYDLPEYRVDGPEWIRTEHFDISAKFPEALPKDPQQRAEVFKAMMQKMLADRFHVVIHREQRTMAVYALLVGKKGIKFRQVPDTDSHSSNSENRQYEGKCIPMTTLATFLSQWMDLPVLDFTGLQGFYDLKLQWTAERSSSAKPEAADSPVGLTIEDAVEEQLGLRLEHRKSPVEVLVVDRADKIPAENL
jgi:uncharacterized protein (TIGR03435 family)